MDKNAIKKFAVWARCELIGRVSQRAMIFGITAEDAGDPNAESVSGHLLSRAEKRQRQALIRKIREKGYEQVMEEVAYTWFNRFAALRFMEVNGYLPSHIRVFTNDTGEFKPQILTEAIHLELDGLDMDRVYELESANRSEELFKYLLIVQCNALNSILPGMFQKIDDYTELLLPDYLLREGSVIEQMVTMIPEADWTDQVQIIGWLYQYYNTELKDKVFAALKKNIKISKENIPAATQLFTPDWIVHYMVENSLGRLWLEGHPNDALKSEWKYYLDEAEQEPEVQAQLEEIRKEYAALKPEEIRVIDPCMGSGHILCVLFDVLVQIYEDYGYTAREAVAKIVENNLWGLDIDGRAAQLAYFAVMMKARQYDRRFFIRGIQPHVYAPGGYPDGELYGSLITVDELEPEPVEENRTLFDADFAVARNTWNFRRALAQKYDVVVTNPPYMGTSNMNLALTTFIKEHYTDYKSDFFSAFMVRCSEMTKREGYCGFFTPYVWMFIQSYEKLRKYLYKNCTIETLIQFEYSAFEEATVPVCTLAFKNNHTHGKKGCYFRLTDFRGGMEVQRLKTLEAISNHDCGYYYEQNSDNFTKIPGAPVAYWLSLNLFDVFGNEPPLASISKPKTGMRTGDNERFLRIWYEVQWSKLAFGCLNKDEALRTHAKWFPYNKGGDFRVWYGNNSLVVNWENDGNEIKENTRRVYPQLGDNLGWKITNEQDYFRKGITWTALTSSSNSFRYSPSGFIFDSNKGPMLFAEGDYLLLLLGLLTSAVSKYILAILNPTLSLQNGDLEKLPVLFPVEKDLVVQFVKENIAIAKEEWDFFETSWDFQRHPLIPLLWRGAPVGGGVVPLHGGAPEKGGGVSGLTNHPVSYAATPPGEETTPALRAPPPEEGNYPPVSDAVTPPGEGNEKVVRSSRNYMSLPYNPKLKERARELRKAGNLSEVLLWNQLKNGQVNSWDFDRQKIIGNFIVDFYCANVGLVVEVDGSSHDSKQEYDSERDAYLKGLGLDVLHFSDRDVKTDIEGVVGMIRNYSRDHAVIPLLWRGGSEADGVVGFSRPEDHPAPFGGTPPEEGNYGIAECYAVWEEQCSRRFAQLKANEEELNRIFIEIYGLQGELTPEVEDKDVTVRKADLQRDIRSLLSYAVGCMFGRYSLDVPGLAYAGGEWDASKYKTFLPDQDAIIPICDDEYFEDDIVGRFVKFVEVVYGRDTLEENLRFIADALGGKGSSREVVRRYFINDFYADHLKVYQKRPIYWLFDSGKKNGFKCLIYMHRYQPDTIARIRTDYVHEQQSRYRTAISDLEQRINGASASERVKLSKRLAKLQEQAEETRIYEEKIHHLADQMIKIDLDDGVKVNYAKFQDVLAKIK